MTKTYGIWATVSGGVTGSRSAWFKTNGEQFETQSLPYAERMATNLNQQMNNHPGPARFHYEVVQL